MHATDASSAFIVLNTGGCFSATRRFTLIQDLSFETLQLVLHCHELFTKVSNFVRSCSVPLTNHTDGFIGLFLLEAEQLDVQFGLTNSLDTGTVKECGKREDLTL